jgi:hypothetical protein
MQFDPASWHTRRAGSAGLIAKENIMIDGYWNLAEDEEVGRVRAKLILCDECDDFAEVECEDLRGYSRRPCDYLCRRCYDQRRERELADDQA